MVNGEAGKGDAYRPLPDFNKNYIKIFGKKKPKPKDQDIHTNETEVQHEAKKDKSAERKLRKYLGYAYPNKSLVEITPNQRPRQYLDTLIHELLHVMYPKDSESKISQNASTITHHIWKKNYRRL